MTNPIILYWELNLIKTFPCSVDSTITCQKTWRFFVVHWKWISKNARNPFKKDLSVTIMFLTSCLTDDSSATNLKVTKYRDTFVKPVLDFHLWKIQKFHTLFLRILKLLKICSWIQKKKNNFQSDEAWHIQSRI